jgi:hypothetical protein
MSVTGGGEFSDEDELERAAASSPQEFENTEAATELARERRRRRWKRLLHPLTKEDPEDTD